MFIVENFLCCFELETGGLVLGWLGVITEIISIVVMLILCFVIPTISCRDVQKYFKEAGKELSIDDCEMLRNVVIVALIVTILFVIGFIVIDVLLIKGTKKRDHILIRPAVIVVAVFGILLTAANVLTFSVLGIITAVFYAVIYAYTYACLYSLYLKIRDEKHGNAEYMHP